MPHRARRNAARADPGFLVTAPLLKTELLIWWTTDAESRAIGTQAPVTLPAYVREQYLSRVGRSGRGRLWVDEKFGPREISEWPDTFIGRMIQEGTSAGIVFAGSDLPLFKGVAGIVTDFRLRMLWPK